MTEHLDVLVVGAGLSGIDAGYRLQTQASDRSYAILESRDAIGGTWDLFRYPGIRSDSDMFTLGFPFRPWKDAKSIADGPAIRQYVRDTAAETGVDQHIRFGHKVVDASWSTEEARWTVTVEIRRGDGVVEERELTCGFLYFCSGYYSYDEGHLPEFPGLADYEGVLVQPQFWPEDLDYAGRRVVVIGSGATAVTLLPSMADAAGHVTMLQRSPSYIATLPAVDPIATFTRGVLPEKVAHALMRGKNAVLAFALFQVCRRFPERASRFLRGKVAEQLPDGYDVATHFTPTYKPWDQRMCLVPNGDLFKAIRSGKASVVTDHIRTFTPKGILLESGEELQADVVVAATGLKLQVLGGASLTVDGEPVDLSKRFVYKGVMLDGVPNAALCIGYTNASWTLRADLASQYVCRLLQHMRSGGYDVAVPRADHAAVQERPLLNLDSGYIQRAAAGLPKQGSVKPWYMRQNYFLDYRSMKYGEVADGLELNRSRGRVPA